MKAVLQYFKDVLYARTAQAKALERIAECMEQSVEQIKKNSAKEEESIARLRSLLTKRSPSPFSDSSLLEDALNNWRRS